MRTAMTDQELERLRADARRYQQLKAMCRAEGRDGGWIGVFSFPLIGAWDDTPYSKDRGEGFHYMDLDEALDATRKAP